MDIKVCFNTEFDLSNSFCTPSPLKEIVNVDGVGVFDDNDKILPIISHYLSYQTLHEKIAIKSSLTYARNLTYFLQYIRSRDDFSDNESDEIFITVPSYVIQEYLTHLSGKGLKSSTIRNRDASLEALFKFLCSSFDGYPPVRKDNPYIHGYLSKTPKRSVIDSCTIDELIVLIKSTNSERERTILQFLYDSGLRRSELPRLSLEDFNNAVKFNSQNLIAEDSDQVTLSNYIPLFVRGSKGRANEIKPRWTLITSATLRRIQKYHASPLYKGQIRKFKNSVDTPAFLNSVGTRYTAIAINKLLERISKRAMRQGHLKRVISPHKLRHGYAYMNLQSNDFGENTVDRLVMLQKHLGHNSHKTTEMYTQISHKFLSTICDENGDLLTRAEKLERIAVQTRLKTYI